MPGMTESTCPALCLTQMIHLDQYSPDDRSKYHLRNALTGLNGNGVMPVVDENDANLTAVIGIYGSGCIHQRDPMTQRKAASGANLGLIPFRDGNCETGRDKNALTRPQYNWRIKNRMKIHPGGQIRHIPREDHFTSGPHALYLNCNSG
jgi:hypothetical protein